jgi:hypothetical protein
VEVVGEKIKRITNNTNYLNMEDFSNKKKKDLTFNISFNQSIVKDSEIWVCDCTNIVN